MMRTWRNCIAGMNSTQWQSTIFALRSTSVAGLCFVLICFILTYIFSSRSAGVVIEDKIPTLTDADIEAAKNELAGRTGETESESDALSEGDDEREQSEHAHIMKLYLLCLVMNKE